MTTIDRRARSTLATGLAIVLAILACQLGAGCATTTNVQPTSETGYAARHSLARELVSRGDWGRAFAMLDDLHRERPKDTDVLTMRGIVYRERGLFNDAEADLKEVLNLAPESADAHAALGILYDVQMRSEAEAEHRVAVKLAPNNPAFLNNLGFSLYLRHRFKEAVKSYESAARLAPLSRRCGPTWASRAPPWAIRRAAREFQMGGSEAEAKNNLGFAYERRGDMANAFDLYLEAVRLNPKGERARSNLVHAALVLGRPVPAEAAPSAPPPEGAEGAGAQVPAPAATANTSSPDRPDKEAHQ